MMIKYSLLCIALLLVHTMAHQSQNLQSKGLSRKFEKHEDFERRLGDREVSAATHAPLTSRNSIPHSNVTIVAQLGGAAAAIKLGVMFTVW